jgi:glycosidase
MILLILACYAPPEWENPTITNHVDDWRDEIIYQLITDRFANGDINNDHNVTLDPTDLNRYHGGDWQGIIDQADYLSELGVTTLWISPVVANVEEDAGVAGYHGYWAQDFTRTNPHMGDLGTLRRLVEEMHQRDIKVVVDIVANHIGQLFYYDINQNGQADIQTWYATDGTDEMEIVTEWDPGYDPRGIQSFSSLGESGPAPLGWVYMPEINRVPPLPAEFQREDWYHQMGRVTDWEDEEQVRLADFPGGLKDLATENPNVREALIRVYADWITWTNIDGFRIDTVKHVEPEFWEVFCPAIRAHARDLGKENFLLFGEVFSGDETLQASYTQTGQLDSLVWFSEKYRVFDGVFKQGGATSAIEELYAERALLWGQSPQEGGVGLAPVDLPIHFLDNHDVARFLSEQPSEQALQAALAFMYLAEGLPILYYGTEQGFDGGNDPANREPLWDSGYRRDGALFLWLASLAALRAETEPLRRGDMHFTWSTDHTADEEDAGMLAFEREGANGKVLVAINTHPTRASHTEDESGAMALSFAPGTVLQQLWPEGAARQFGVGSDGTLSLELQPYEVVVLTPL